MDTRACNRGDVNDRPLGAFQLFKQASRQHDRSKEVDPENMFPDASAVSIEDSRLPPSALGEIAALLTRACSPRDSSRCLISSIAERVSSGLARSTWM